jgi:hypothetical protein
LKEIDGLSAKLYVAQAKIGHAYNEGMGDFEELKLQLQRRETEVAELQRNIQKVVSDSPYHHHFTLPLLIL